MSEGLSTQRGPENVPIAIQGDLRWQLAERIVISPHFVKSQRLSDFLLFVTAETLSGRSEVLNEHCIGINVFERRADYDSADDNIVRSHASRLRQRLDAYFLAEGKAEPLRLVLRRGSYIPHFEPVKLEPLGDPPPLDNPIDESPRILPSPSTEVPKLFERPRWPVLVLSGALILSCLGTAIEWHRQRANAAMKQAPSIAMKTLWSELFPAGKRALIVPADSSLVLYENLTGKTVSLPEYTSKTYLSSSQTQPPKNADGIANRIAHRRLTSVADVELTAALLCIPEVESAKPQIRFARDLQMVDLKEANAILIGAEESDPWLSIFQPSRNFTITDDQNTRVFTVFNRAPRNGESSAYRVDPHDNGNKAYALIALEHNLGSGMVLIVEGTSIAGTEAAADFLTEGSQMENALAPAFKQYERIPSFELLLETVNIAGTSPQSKVIAIRLNP